MQIPVRLPTHLDLYTEGEREFTLSMTECGTVADLLVALDARFPGIRFRMINEQDGIRRHIRIFIAGEQTKSLQTVLKDGDEVMIVAALSGG